MPQAITTVDKIDKLAEAIPTNLIELAERANAQGTYFWAYLRMRYVQDFDTDVDKGASASGKAEAPGLAAGGVDVGGSAKVGAQFTKSRDGRIDNDQEMVFMSLAALAHGPLVVKQVNNLRHVGHVGSTATDENPTDGGVDDELG